MAKIELSAAWVNRMIPRLFMLSSDGGLNSQNHANYLSHGGLLNVDDNGYSGQYSKGGIWLMKGVQPTGIPPLAKLNDYVDNALVKFKTGNLVPGDFNGSQVNKNPAIVNSIYVPAIADGTATWFWWFVAPLRPSYGEYDYTTAVRQSIIGSVGVTNSGADLEMAVNEIISGQEYRIKNLKIEFPTSWNA